MQVAGDDDSKPAAIEKTPISSRSPVKRKSNEFSDIEGTFKRKKDASLLGSLSECTTTSRDESTRSSHQKRPSPRRRTSKYLNDDDCQDCCYDPLLGAVTDLVHSCPEAVGIPDMREYEETPLIVALKSNFYVVMEPDTEFQLPADAPGGGGLAGGLPVGQGFDIFGGGVNAPVGGGFPFQELGQAFMHRPVFSAGDDALLTILTGRGRTDTLDSATTCRNSSLDSPQISSADPPTSTENGASEKEEQTAECERKREFDEDDESSSVSDESEFDGEGDPRSDAFIPSSNERLYSFGATESAGVQLGLVPRRQPRYDYQTALEYRIFCLVRIMLNAYPRSACLRISDYSPLHSAVFHGRCPDTIRLLLDAESRFSSSHANKDEANDAPSSSTQIPIIREPCPVLSGPAMLCTNTRGELPLHFACMRNESARSIRLLVEADPRASLVRDAAGRTPLRWLWIRFVDGLLDRFGGRDTQREDEAVPHPSFHEQEDNASINFPNPARSIIGGAGTDGNRELPLNNFGRGYLSSDSNAGNEISEQMFVFDTEYIRRTRNVDRTVDFLRMRHVPSGFEAIEYVAAEHAITVLLKLKYLQQRRNRQLEAYNAARNFGGIVELPADVHMSAKEEFILYAFEKATALIYATALASEAEEETAAIDAAREEGTRHDNDPGGDLPWRKRLWHTLPEANSNKRFFLVHEACRSRRASCPASIALICIKLFSDQLFERDDVGQLPLHKVASRGIGWEPPGSDMMDTRQASLADETLTLLKEVLSASHEEASSTYDNNQQLPLHCAVDSLVTSLVMGKERRASLNAEARSSLQKHRHTHVEIALKCLSELLLANSSALAERDGKTGLYPFMQAALPHVKDCAVVKYTSELGRPGALGHSSMDTDVIEENEADAETDQTTIIFYLLREDPSVINAL